MGTTEYRIKQGYSLHSRPLFRTPFVQGIQSSLQITSLKRSRSRSDSLQPNKSILQQSCFIDGHHVNTKKLQAHSPKFISSSTEYPYTAVGLIRAELDDQEIYGTGCLIGGNCVLTCAHNCYSIHSKELAKNITFTPGFGANQSGLTFHTKSVHIPQCFKDTLENGNNLDELLLKDYALLELDSPTDITIQYGSLGIDCTDNDNECGQQFILGYTKHHKHISLCKFQGEYALQKGLIKYNMEGDYGLNGAPIIQKRGSSYVVRGLHVYCFNRNGQIEQGGIKLYQTIFDQLRQWVSVQEEQVQLREKNIGKDGLKYLSKYPWKKLVSLILTKDKLTDNACKYFRKGNWKDLVNLDLGGNKIGVDGVHELSQGNFCSLKTLNLWGNDIEKGGVYYLSLTKFDNLVSLNLYNNEIGDEGAQNLSQAEWKSLANLNVGRNKLTAEGAYSIAKSKYFNLITLNLWGNNLQSEQNLLKQHMLARFKKLRFLTV